MGKEKLIEEIEDIQSYIKQSINDEYYDYETEKSFKREFCDKFDLACQLQQLIGWIADDKHLTA